MDIIGSDQLKELDSLDEVSRKQWRGTAAIFIIQNCGNRETLEALIAAGRSKFMGDAKSQFHGHAFKSSDYEWIWGKLGDALYQIKKLEAKRKVTLAAG